MIKVGAEAVAIAIGYLVEDGFFIDQDVDGPSLSTPQGAEAWVTAIEEREYEGDLITDANEDGGNWVYFICDQLRFEIGEARVAAAKKAALARTK